MNAVERIRMTTSCRDTDAIPKVPGAGEVFADGADRYQLMHNGIKVVEHGYYGTWMTEIIRLLRGHHEPQEEKAFHEILRHIGPNAAMVELGSYWSYYSLWFQRCVSGAINHMIEPDPSNLEIGKRNFGLNNASGTFHQFWIGAEPACNPDIMSGNDEAPRTIAQISVDAFMDMTGLPAIDLLLADIQGAELDMLEGARRTIADGKLRFLVLSTHHHSISNDPLTHQRCLRFVNECKAHVLAEHSVPESFSGDGLIVASFDPSDKDLPRIAVSRNVAAQSLYPETEYDLAAAWEHCRALEARVARFEKYLAPLLWVRRHLRKLAA